jgi:hypothetical protein
MCARLYRTELSRLAEDLAYSCMRTCGKPRVLMQEAKKQAIEQANGHKIELVYK